MHCMLQNFSSHAPHIELHTVEWSRSGPRGGIRPLEFLRVLRGGGRWHGLRCDASMSPRLFSWPCPHSCTGKPQQTPELRCRNDGLSGTSWLDEYHQLQQLSRRDAVDLVCASSGLIVILHQHCAAAHECKKSDVTSPLTACL